jgi:replicative DNA helicase
MTDIESILIGGFIRHPEIIDDVRTEPFFSPKIRTLFDGIVSLVKKKSPVDQVLLSRVSGVPVHEILEIQENYFDGMDLDHYKELLKAESRRREMQEFLSETLKEIKESSLDYTEIEGKISQRILNLVSRDDHKSQTATDILKQVIQDYYDRKVERENGRRIFGIPTGFTKLDDTLGGLQAGTFCVVAGRLHHGKSTVAMDIFLNALHEGISSLYVSLEQPSSEILLHLIQKETGISPLKIKTGDLSEQQEGSLTNEIYRRFKEYPIHLDDQIRTLADLTLKIRRMVLTHGVRFIVIDYLQLIENPVKVEPRHIQVAGISRGIKRLAMDLGISILGIAQLNRNPEERESKRLSPADIRESEAIGQDADYIVFIHRPRLMGKDDSDFLELAKNRLGKSIPRINVRHDDMRNTYSEGRSNP